MDRRRRCALRISHNHLDLAAAGGATVVAAAGLWWPLRAVDPAARAALHTVISAIAVSAAVVLGLQFRERRRAHDPFLFATLVAIGVSDLAFSAVPGLLGAGRTRSGIDTGLVLGVGTASVYALVGIAFLAAGRPGDGRGRLLATVVFLLAAARLQVLVIPSAVAGAVTFADLDRTAAYALLLIGAIRSFQTMHHAAASMALGAERERLAREIHDGLAQDLAVIAVQAHRLEPALGPHSPLAIASRRALAASRSAIVDLSASAAPTTLLALDEVARELQTTLQLDVVVRLLDEGPSEPQLAPGTREHAVRVAREAIVNAARHGRARHVEVTMRRAGPRWLLTVADDGNGVPAHPDGLSAGFGVRAMRSRAGETGGQLTVTPRAGGGTVVEMTLPEGRASAPRALIARGRLGRALGRWPWPCC